MLEHSTRPVAPVLPLRIITSICAAAALCTSITFTASAASHTTTSTIPLTDTITVPTLSDASCIGSDPVASRIAPGGSFLFVFHKDGAICRINTSDMSVDGTVHVDGGFATAKPHVEFSPDGRTMFVNAMKGIVTIRLSDLRATSFSTAGDDYLLSPDGSRITVIEPESAASDGATPRSWTLRTFALADGEDVAVVPLHSPVAFSDVMSYTPNTDGTVWLVGIGDDIKSGHPVHLMAIDVASGIMNDIADDVSPTVYAVNANTHALYVGTTDERVLSVDADADSQPDSTVVRTLFERHLPLTDILLAPNGSRALIGMTNGKLVVDADTMQWLETGNITSFLSSDGSLLYAIDRGETSNDAQTGDTHDTANELTLRVNTLAEGDPTVTRTLRLEGANGHDLRRAIDAMLSPDGKTAYVLLTGDGNANANALLTIDVSSFSADAVRHAVPEAARPALNTPAIAVIVAVAAALALAIVLVRRRTDW